MARNLGREARVGMRHRYMTGVSGFSGANHYKTADPGGVAGVGTGFWVAVLLRRTGNNASNGRPAARTNANTGWRFDTPSASKSITFNIGTGAARIASPTATMVDGHNLVVGIYDTANCRIFCNKVEAGTGTTATSFTALSQYTILGTSFEGNPYDDAVYGISGGHSIPTSFEIAQLYDAVKSGYDIQGIPGKTTHLWSFKRDSLGFGAVTTLGDKYGADAMTKAGTLTVTWETPKLAW